MKIYYSSNNSTTYNKAIASSKTKGNPLTNQKTPLARAVDNFLNNFPKSYAQALNWRE